METTIYLWVTDEGWKPFKLSDTEELIKRNITIGYNAKIGYSATIGDRATIGDDAMIGYNAKIGNDATIGDGATIGYNAKIGNYATIGNDAKIGDRATIGDGATICYAAKIGDDATIGNYAKIGKTLLITGSRHTVNYYGLDIIHIGWIRKSIAELREQYAEIFMDEDYTQEQIEEYKGYIELIATLHETWNVELKTNE